MDIEKKIPRGNMFIETKGSTHMNIQGLDVYIPKKPAKRLIDGHDLRKKDQKFKRTELPKDWAERREDEDYEIESRGDPDYRDPYLEAFRSQEWNRRIDGYWFYNNGTPTYITGTHYMYVNWWKCDFGYPDYRDPDRLNYYFVQGTIGDPCCMGINEITLRRDGKTARSGLHNYEYTSRTKNSYAGIQSKTSPDAKKVFEDSIILPWKNLPDFFRPVYDYNSTQKSELRFFKPSTKGKKAKRKRVEGEDLQSYITYKSSEKFSYDGSKLHRMIMDEVGKTKKTEVDVWERHQIVMPCFEQDGEIIGKMYCTTTVEDMQDVGDGFEKLTNASNINEKSENGRTKSGLYTYFKPAYMGRKHDEYGFPLIEENKKYFLAEREARKDDPRALSSFIRKNPFTIEEAFMIDGDACVFNAMVLNDRYTELNSRTNVTIQGDLVWVDGIEDGRVEFVANTVSGKFLLSYIFDSDDESNKTAERFRNGEKIFLPLNDEKFAIATDPVDHGATVDGSRSSNAAAYGFRKYDMLLDSPDKMKFGKTNWVTNTFCFEYVNRPSEPTIYYEDMIRACTYYGCQILVENNKRGIITHFYNRGYKNFIMNRPRETFTNMNSDAQDTPGAPSTKPMIQQYTAKLQTYVEKFGHSIPFVRLIKSLLKFDPNKPTKFDEAVAAGFCLIAQENAVTKASKPIDGQAFVQYYDNSGKYSVPK